MLNSNFGKKISNVYYDNPNIKQGIKFDNNADGSFFTFRPILNENILQITKNDAVGIVNIDSSGNFNISGDFTNGNGISLNSLNKNLSVQPLYAEGWIIDGENAVGIGLVSGVRNPSNGFSTINFNVKIAGLSGKTYNWGINYNEVCRMLGFTTYTVACRGTATVFTSDGIISREVTGYGGYIDTNTPHSGIGRVYGGSLAEKSVFVGNWETTAFNIGDYITGTIYMYLN